MRRRPAGSPPNAATTGRDSFARVAVDGQGDAVAVWARFVPLNSWEIVAASRPRGGQWGSYTTLTRGHRTVSLRPKVAVDPNGNAVALWVARPPEGNENVFNSIWASERTPDGQWSEPYEISVASGARGYELVIGAEGTATALWYSLKEDDEDEESEGGEDEGGASPGHWFIRSSRRPLGGSWSPPADISGPTLGEPDLALAANATGDVAAVWRTTEGEYVIEDGEEVLHVTPVLRANQRPADGDWAAESDYLAEGPGGVGAPVVTVGAEGDITAAWPYQDGGDIGLRTAYRSAASGEWDAPTLLWDDVYDEVQPGVTLASGSQGETGAIWSSFEPGGHVMRFSENVDGTWSEPVVLAGPGGGTGAKIAATNPWLVFDPQGNLTATRVVAGSRIQAAHRPAGEDWGEPVWLSGFDDLWEAQIAVDPEGYVTAIWAGDTAVRSRVYDAVAPTLGSVTVPTEGVVGDQIAMAAEPFDVWSAVTTTWDFGDGGDATGATS